MSIFGALIVCGVAAFAFAGGWFSSRAFFLGQFLESREEDALKRQRELRDAKRRYPPRDGVQPVIIRKARILGDPKNIDS